MAGGPPAPRLLLVGGTFDPPHRAHVELPRHAARVIGAERIVYVPAAQNPLKDEAPRASAEHRLAMLGLALRDVPEAEISTVEIERGGRSYFVDTLRAVAASHPGFALRFLLGADQALEFGRWRDPEGILRLAEPLVVPRPGWDPDRYRRDLEARYGPANARDWLRRTIDAPLFDVSATDLRRRLAADEPLGDAIDAEVLRYIRQQGLYGAGSS